MPQLPAKRPDLPPRQQPTAARGTRRGRSRPCATVPPGAPQAFARRRSALRSPVGTPPRDHPTTVPRPVTGSAASDLLHRSEAHPGPGLHAHGVPPLAVPGARLPPSSAAVCGEKHGPAGGGGEPEEVGQPPGVHPCVRPPTPSPTAPGGTANWPTAGATGHPVRPAEIEVAACGAECGHAAGVAPTEGPPGARPCANPAPSRTPPRPVHPCPTSAVHAGQRHTLGRRARAAAVFHPPQPATRRLQRGRVGVGPGHGDAGDGAPRLGARSQ